MADIPSDVVLGQVLAVLREAFEGSAEKWSYFLDSGPEAGLLSMLSGLSAAEASRPIAGTSIAAHVHHVVFGLGASAAWIQGEHTPHDWKQSWRVTTVEKEAWSQLLAHLREGYQALAQAIEHYGASSVEAAGGAVGGLAHVAYHAGAIRQKAALCRSA
jgi:hypothetical protein